MLNTQYCVHVLQSALGYIKYSFIFKCYNYNSVYNHINQLLYYYNQYKMWCRGRDFEIVTVIGVVTYLAKSLFWII